MQNNMRHYINLIESAQTEAELLDEGMADKVKGAILGAAITFAAINTDLDKVFVEPVKGAIEQFKATDKQTKDTVAVVDPDNKSIINNWVDRYNKWREFNNQQAIVDQENKQRDQRDAKAKRDKLADKQKRIQAYDREVSNPWQVVAFQQKSWYMDKFTNEYMPTAKVEVMIYNRNKYVAIKDSVIECKWLTENNTLLKTTQETVYDSINPGEKFEATIEFPFPFTNKAKYINRGRCTLKSVEYHKTVRKPYYKYE